MKKLIMLAVVALMAAMALTSCADDDNGGVEPAANVLQDGTWTGSGEVTGGLHGANRLGGNGVADIVVNGRLAGLAASERLK